MEFEDKNLSIVASFGNLTVWDKANYYPDTIEELPLSKLEKLYKRWQHTVRLVKEDKLGTCLLNNKALRDRLLRLLKDFGFSHYNNFTVSQIEALLFYYTNSNNKIEEALLWQFHNTFPRTLDLPEKEDVDKVTLEGVAPDLDIFETAQLYLMQKEKMDLAGTMPLSKIMKLVLSDSFILWINDPNNKKMLSDKQFKQSLEDKPVTKGDLMRLMGKTK